MRILIAVFCLLCILAQGGMAYLWQDPDVVAEFQTIFSVFYQSGMPLWSEMAFAFGRKWFLITSLLFGFWLIAVLPLKTPYALRITTICAALALGLMWYAMYPLHLMLGGAYAV